MISRNSMQERKARSPRPVTLAALVAYVALVVPAAINNVERVNPDGVCYIRLAQHIAEGRAWESVSSWWPPLISWCMAPLLAAGVDGLAAARIVLAAWGAVLVAAAAVLARHLADLSGAWRPLPPLLIAGAAVYWAINLISPDLIVAACLMLYFNAVLHPRLLESRGRQLLCGLLGGVAYLAKAYALPFFLVHFLFTVILRWRLGRAAESNGAPAACAAGPGRADLLKSCGAGIFGLLLVAGPWIGLISWKDGRFTISSAAGGTYARMGPRDEKRRPLRAGLRTPPPGRLSVWETPEALPREAWSPFEKTDHLLFQARQMCRRIWHACNIIREFDRLGLSLYFVCALPALAFLLRRRREDMFRSLWLLGTVALYCSGYILIVVRPRFIEPVLFPPLCIAGLHFAALLAARLSVPGRRAGRAVAWLAAAALVISFGQPLFSRLVLGRTIRGHTNSYRSFARRLRAKGCTGPLACRAPDYWYGLYVAYHTGQPYLGMPSAVDRAECEAELDEHGVQVFVVWHDRSPAEPIADSAAWVRVLTAHSPDPRSNCLVDVYVRRQNVPRPQSEGTR